MKKLTNMFAVAALSAASTAPALAQDASGADPFVSTQNGMEINTVTGVAIGTTLFAFALALSDSDSSSSSTTTSTSP